MNNHESFERIGAWLSARARLLLLAHERPDGDAYGSLLGLQAGASISIPFRAESRRPLHCEALALE